MYAWIYCWFVIVHRVYLALGSCVQSRHRRDNLHYRMQTRTCWVHTYSAQPRRCTLSTRCTGWVWPRHLSFKNNRVMSSVLALGNIDADYFGWCRVTRLCRAPRLLVSSSSACAEHLGLCRAPRLLVLSSSTGAEHLDLCRAPLQVPNTSACAEFLSWCRTLRFVPSSSTGTQWLGTRVCWVGLNKPKPQVHWHSETHKNWVGFRLSTIPLGLGSHNLDSGHRVCTQHAEWEIYRGRVHKWHVDWVFGTQLDSVNSMTQRHWPSWHSVELTRTRHSVNELESWVWPELGWLVGLKIDCRVGVWNPLGLSSPEWHMIAEWVLETHSNLAQIHSKFYQSCSCCSVNWFSVLVDWSS